MDRGEKGGNGGKWGTTGLKLGTYGAGLKGLHAFHGSPFTILPLFPMDHLHPQRGALHSAEGVQLCN